MNQPVRSADSRQLLMLIKSVGRLALPATSQERYLTAEGFWPSLDELALEFGDLMVLADQFVRRELLTPREADVLHRLNDMLVSMGGQQHQELWSGDALRGRRWADVRSVAAEFLSTPDRWEGELTCRA